MLQRLYAKPSSINSLALGLLVVVMGAVFLWRQPTLQSRLWPETDLSQLETWVGQVKDTGVDAAGWWEFRDRYSPGYFHYNSELLEPYSILQFKALPDDRNHLFTFISPRLVSDEWLVRTNHVLWQRWEWQASWEAQRQAEGLTPADWEVVVDQPSSLVLQTKNGRFFGLWMERSVAEMKLVNGLINYDDPKRLLERDWHWVTTAEGVAAPAELQPDQLSSRSGKLLHPLEDSLEVAGSP